MKFTKQNLIDLCPCSEGLIFARAKKFDWQTIWQDCDRSDWLIWWLRRTRQMDKPLAVRISVPCAEHVLPKFETKHPGDLQPRNAIESAKSWLVNPCQTAAAAAAAAAYTTYAYTTSSSFAAVFAAAAYTAYTASSTNDYAAWANYAVLAAAAADTTDTDTNVKTDELKWQSEKIREIVGKCPFEN